MEIIVNKSAEDLGKKAAQNASKAINQAINENGSARILLSTGASQFTTIDALLKEDIDWTKVEMFHLDEYVGLEESHNASFRKYLKERFTNHIDIKKAHFVSGEGNVDENINKLTKAVMKAPIDVSLIGIGENSHIAFNDPPANFDTKESYIVVELDDKCKMQQVREGWFETINDVPDKAITMTVYQIMQSKKIITCVPYEQKAKAVKDTIENDVTNMIPATMLKTHEDWTLYLDEESASLLSDRDKELYS